MAILFQPRLESDTTMAAEEANTSASASTDLLFHQGLDRFVLLPIRLPAVWAAYKQQLDCFWTADIVDLSKDVQHWRALSDAERAFIKTVLAFFAASDGIVGENLVMNFMSEFEAPEVRCFYGFQAAMENIHSEMYSLLIDVLIDDSAEKTKLFQAIQHYPCVAAKAQWAMRWMGLADDGSKEGAAETGTAARPGIGQRLVAFSAVEGIFFSCSFCAIYWLRKKGVMPGLCQSNEYIARDEGMHTAFAAQLVTMLPACPHAAESQGCSVACACRGRSRPPAALIKTIILQAVDIERAFVRDALQLDLIGINSRMMEQYLECVADGLLGMLGVGAHFGTPNPFPWMDLINLSPKLNFFENRVTQYRRAGHAQPTAGFQVTTDF